MKQKMKSTTQVLRKRFFTFTTLGTFFGLTLLYIQFYYLNTGSLEFLGEGILLTFVMGWVFEPFHWVLIFPVTAILALCTSKVATSIMLPHNYEPVFVQHLAGSIGLSLAITLAILIPLFMNTVCTGYISICL